MSAPGDNRHPLCRAGAVLSTDPHSRGREKGRGVAQPMGGCQASRNMTHKSLQRAGGGFIEIKVCINNPVPFQEQRQPAPARLWGCLSPTAGWGALATPRAGGPAGMGAAPALVASPEGTGTVLVSQEENCEGRWKGMR